VRNKKYPDNSQSFVGILTAASIFLLCTIQEKQTAERDMASTCRWLALFFGRGLGVFLKVVLAFSFVSVASRADTFNLIKTGPDVARELELIEYSVTLINEGASSAQNLNVLDVLPQEIEFVDGISEPVGSYDPASGIWSVPWIGNEEPESTVTLKISGLVRPIPLSSQEDFVTITNEAEITDPVIPDAVPVSHRTDIVCSTCIDWEIVSTELGMDHEVNASSDPAFEVRFFLRVLVANNGPVASDGALEVRSFDVWGGGLDGSFALSPASPVAISLGAGETEQFVFSTNWAEGPKEDYSVAWKVEVRDSVLFDPILPNSVSGSWKGKVEDSGGGGCFIATAAFGSPLDDRVVVLKRFRDEVLMTTRFGREIVATYYRFSPPIASTIGESHMLKTMVRLGLVPIVLFIEHFYLALWLSGSTILAAIACYRQSRLTR
jgi:uncharacterized repeat protein (TIGR01451 family)